MSALQILTDYRFFHEEDPAFSKLKIIDKEITRYCFFLESLRQARRELIEKEKETFDIIKEF